MEVFEGDYSHHCGKRAAALIENIHCSAAFLFNDMMAYGFCQELLQNGIKIPDDFSVVGFDDAFFSEIFQSPLTTVRQPAYDIGCTAMEVALEEIASFSKTKKMISFEPELIIRKSTGHCKVKNSRANPSAL